MQLIPEKLYDLFPVEELPAGEAGKCKAGPMKFTIRHFSVEGVGHLSVMEGSAMLGLMKMDTVILTPLLRDAPLFSYDRIRAMGKDTLILEYYDTLLSPDRRQAYAHLADRKETLSHVPEYDLGEHWYDPLKLPGSVSKRAGGAGESFDRFYSESLLSFLEELKTCPAADPEKKREKTSQYVSGLFENGGPSTDAFVKAIGKEAAVSLFETVIFGVSRK